MADTPGNDQALVSEEGSASQPTGRASITDWKQGSTHGEDTEAMELDDPTATTPKAESKDEDLGSLEAIQHEEVKEIDTQEELKEEDAQEELIMKLFDMVRDVSAEQLALNQLEITGTICRLKELQDQQPPKASFNPAIANSCRERLEGALTYLASELSAIPPGNWTRYKRKLIKFSQSERILNMTFPQRLYKVVGIVYLPEEMDAIPKEEFERLHTVARICVAAAQAMGPESENEQVRAEKWISAKMQDLEFLKKMFRSVRGIYKASAPEQTEMPWETQASENDNGQACEACEACDGSTQSF